MLLVFDATGGAERNLTISSADYPTFKLSGKQLSEVEVKADVWLMHKYGKLEVQRRPPLRCRNRRLTLHLYDGVAEDVVWTSLPPPRLKSRVKPAPAA